MTVGSVTGTFAATGDSAEVELVGPINLSLTGTWVATVKLQRSFDDGVTFLDVASYTANAEELGAKVEPESGVLYRLSCSAYTSGTVTYRLSQ